MTLTLTKKEIMAIYNAGNVVNTILSKIPVVENITENVVWEKFLLEVNKMSNKVVGAEVRYDETRVSIILDENLIVDITNEYKDLLISMVGLGNSLFALSLNAKNNLESKWIKKA